MSKSYCIHFHAPSENCAYYIGDGGSFDLRDVPPSEITPTSFYAWAYDMGTQLGPAGVVYTPEDVSAYQGLTCSPAPEYTWNFGGDYSDARDPGDCRQKFVDEEGTLVDVNMDVCIISDVTDGGSVTCEIWFAPTTQGYPDPRVEQTTAGQTHYAFHWHGATETWTVFVPPPEEEEEEEVVEEEEVPPGEEEVPEEEEDENTD